ncbi:hypothetical protein FJY71_03925 [candidate division WOR-3 bacterium]|nr:hypothetical protein [candidate division WOR-3 bacterium]
MSEGSSLSKWNCPADHAIVCALHHLPVKVVRARRMVRMQGERKLVEADIRVCPEGCCDPHVDEKGNRVPGLSMWARPLPSDKAKANMAAYQKDKAGYLTVTVPVKKLVPTPHKRPVKPAEPKE